MVKICCQLSFVVKSNALYELDWRSCALLCSASAGATAIENTLHSEHNIEYSLERIKSYLVDSTSVFHSVQATLPEPLAHVMAVIQSQNNAYHLAALAALPAAALNAV